MQLKIPYRASKYLYTPENNVALWAKVRKCKVNTQRTKRKSCSCEFECAFCFAWSFLYIRFEYTHQKMFQINHQKPAKKCANQLGNSEQAAGNKRQSMVHFRTNHSSLSLWPKSALSFHCLQLQLYYSNGNISTYVLYIAVYVFVGMCAGAARVKHYHSSTLVKKNSAAFSSKRWVHKQFSSKLVAPPQNETGSNAVQRCNKSMQRCGERSYRQWMRQSSRQWMRIIEKKQSLARFVTRK